MYTITITSLTATMFLTCLLQYWAAEINNGYLVIYTQRIQKESKMHPNMC